MAEGWPKKRRLLGTKIKRLDGPEKATGRAKYSYDINRPGMLHGVILRSPHAHAKIKSIDTTAAKKTPGFKALVVIGVPRRTGSSSRPMRRRHARTQEHPQQEEEGEGRAADREGRRRASRSSARTRS